MFNNCVGRTRDKSIYSILTIIVLISISGGCAGVHDNGGTASFTSNDASLLVNATYIKIRKGNEGKEGWSQEIADEIRRESGIGGYTPFFTEKDGKDTYSFMKYWSGYPQFLEFSPGHHTLAFRIRPGMGGHLLNPPTEGDIDVEAHGVYVLLQEVGYIGTDDHGSYKQDNYIAGKYKILKTNYKYEQSTGIAHHPIDSKLSFKVK